jgi:hypothetical protein
MSPAGPDPTPEPTPDPQATRSGGVLLAEAVGVMTAASGACLVLLPRLILRILGARRRDPAPFFVRVVGMFMMTSGGLLADGARQSPPARIALRWALAQKTGAAIAMVLGVRSKRIGRLALVIAAIDACSAALAARILLASKE